MHRGDPRSSHPVERNVLLVVIPAHCEGERIGRCVVSLRHACDELPDEVIVRVVVAADRCNDHTVAEYRRAAAADARFALIEGAWGSAGATRRVGVDAGLKALEAEAADAWVATTDADSVVPPDWLTLHLAAACSAVDAVAGVVELYPDQDLTKSVAAAFDSSYPVGYGSHPHVHGANLGIRASAYRSVGGFADLGVSEDHELWNALRSAGFHCVSSTRLRVFTSARLKGRAAGGFADTLDARVRALSARVHGASS